MDLSIDDSGPTALSPKTNPTTNQSDCFTRIRVRDAPHTNPTRKAGLSHRVLGTKDVRTNPRRSTLPSFAARARYRHQRPRTRSPAVFDSAANSHSEITDDLDPVTVDDPTEHPSAAGPSHPARSRASTPRNGSSPANSPTAVLLHQVIVTHPTPDVLPRHSPFRSESLDTVYPPTDAPHKPCIGKRLSPPMFQPADPEVTFKSAR